MMGQNKMKLIKEVGKIPSKDFCKLLENAKKENRHEDIKTLRWARCATDMELYSQYYFPHYCELPFNAFHLDSFGDYKFGERSIRRADCAPRGYAKSTIKAFIKIVHDICYGLEDFIVVASNTDTQSTQKLEDVKAELLANDDLIRDYGNFLPNRKAAKTDFIVECGGHKIRMYAIGSKTEVRGIRFGAARPSKIVLDDVEHSLEVENEQIREKYQNWYDDVISKIGNKKTNIEIVGTILHRKSLLNGLLKNPSYNSRSYKAIISWAKNKKLWKKWEEIFIDIDNTNRKEDARKFYEKHEKEMLEGTKVLWEEHESYYELMVEIIENGLRSFMKEKQNSPMDDEEKIFKPSNFQKFKQVEYGIKILKTGIIIPWDELTPIGVIDPATGQKKPSAKKKNDFTCILSGYKDMKGRLFVFEDYTKRVAPTQFIDEIFEQHEVYGFSGFAVETNLYRNLLMKNIIDERKRREKKLKKIIQIPFYEVEQTENKEKRIYTLEPKISHGWILFNETLSDEYYGQFFDFPKANHDDCPDATEMLWNLANGRYQVSDLSKSVYDK